MKNTNIDTVKVFKALAEPSRVSIIKILSEKSAYVEELSQMLNLSASTISSHLKKLEEINLVFSSKEQYYANYHLRKGLLDMTLNQLINNNENINKVEQDERMDDYKNKVLSTFIQKGKLTSIPVQRKKKRIILEELAKNFTLNKEYSEKEVNLMIADYNDDFCTIRRDMISENILSRENAIYKRIN